MSAPTTVTSIDSLLWVYPKPGCTYGSHSESLMDATNTECRILGDYIEQRAQPEDTTLRLYYPYTPPWTEGGYRHCIPGPETCFGSYAEPSCAPGHVTATEYVFQGRTTRHCCLEVPFIYRQSILIDATDHGIIYSTSIDATGITNDATLDISSGAPFMFLVVTRELQNLGVYTPILAPLCEYNWRATGLERSLPSILPNPIPTQTTLWNSAILKGHIAVEGDIASPGPFLSPALTTPLTSNPTTLSSSTLIPTSTPRNILIAKETSTSSLSRPAKIGIGIGVGVSALLLLIAIAILIVVLRKRKTKSTDNTDMLIAYKPELDGEGLARGPDAQEMGGRSIQEMMDTSNPVEVGGSYTHEMMDMSNPVEMGVGASHLASEVEGDHLTYRTETNDGSEENVRSIEAT